MSRNQFYCIHFRGRLIHIHTFFICILISLGVIDILLALSAFYCIRSPTWFSYKKKYKERSEKYAPCCPGWCPVTVSCCVSSLIPLYEYMWIFLEIICPLFFQFCHSISSTFSLFYFHLKGLGGTDVISNACLLPHCLKVRDDYFLMKPGVLTKKKNITCKLWNRQAILSHHSEWEHPLISARHKSHFEVFL